jgi:plastocyanin
MTRHASSPHRRRRGDAGTLQVLRIDSGSIAAGGKFSFTFQNRGTFPYHCTFHPGMIASVVVQ